jgi:hypothetical protein
VDPLQDQDDEQVFEVIRRVVLALNEIDEDHNGAGYDTALQQRVSVVGRHRGAGGCGLYVAGRRSERDERTVHVEEEDGTLRNACHEGTIARKRGTSALVAGPSLGRPRPLNGGQ